MASGTGAIEVLLGENELIRGELIGSADGGCSVILCHGFPGHRRRRSGPQFSIEREQPEAIAPLRSGKKIAPRKRSEEQTSELQSLMRIPDAVFCLNNKTT